MCEELLVYRCLPSLPWGELDRMSGAERRTLIEFVRFLEHREFVRDSMMMAAMGAR